MYRRICILVLTSSLRKASVSPARSIPACGRRTGFPRRILPRQPEHADLGAQPAPFTTAYNPKPTAAQFRACFTGCFVKPVLDTTMNGRVLTKAGCWNLTPETVGDITIERMMPFDLMRQLVRARRQQNPHADPRTGYPARPAVRRATSSIPSWSCATSSCCVRAPTSPIPR